MDSIILASRSPRRREILNRIKIPFIVYEVDVDERIKSLRHIRPSIIEISKRKTEKAAQAFTRGIVVGVDTIVFFNKKVIGKPRNRDEAFYYMRLLKGNHHQVISGITVLDTGTGKKYSSISTTDVLFRDMNDQEIVRYLELGEWMDKAGGYAIQGNASLFIKRIEGSYYNVMGLPVEELYDLLNKFDYFSKSGSYRPVRKL